MTSPTEALKKVLHVLSDMEIDYMVVGSFASSAYGESRDTHDLDLVVVLRKEALRSLADRLGDEFYLDIDAAREAVDRQDMFNAIHYDSGVKTDFWILADDEFRQTQFARRRPTCVWGIQAYIETAEDTILSKLLWNRITPSERQVRDVRGILKFQKGSLDFEYLRKWAIRQGIADELNKLLEEQQCQENHS